MSGLKALWDAVLLAGCKWLACAVLAVILLRVVWRACAYLRVKFSGIPYLSASLLVMCLFKAFVVGGTKTNGVNNLPPRPLLPTLQPIHGGVSVPLNPAFGFQLSSLTPAPQVSQKELAVRSWNICGAWDDSFWNDFGDGFVFPEGTNHLSGVEVLASGEVWRTPFDDDAVATLGVPVSIVPGTTAFSCGMTTNGSCRFDWTDAAVGRDPDSLMTASIELFRNGDVAVTTNGATAYTPRTLPFPHSGFGQDAEWVEANFTNAAGILSTGYPQWVDEQVGVGLTNGLYKLTVSLSDDPPETTFLSVGGLSVAVTNSGECVFLLEKGVEYPLSVFPRDATNFVYSAADDVQPEPPPLRTLPPEGAGVGEWTADGGLLWLYEPSVHEQGGCLWQPFFTGSPGVGRRLGAEQFPMSFSAIVSDYCRSAASVSYQWTTGDSRINIATPNAQTTEISVSSMPDWEDFSLSVTATVEGRELHSSIQRATYGTNDAPVRIAISVPETIGVNDDGDCGGSVLDYERIGRLADDDDIVPVTVMFDAEMPTNGVLRVAPLLPNGWLWLSEDRSSYVDFEDVILLTNCTEFSKTYYLESAESSSGYKSDSITVTWDDGDASLSSQRRITFVECTAEPVNINTVISCGEEHIVNPCCAIVGSNTFMQVSVLPRDFPLDRIKWHVIEGTATFPNGDTGTNVCVVANGDEGDALRLEVDFDGCPGRRPQYNLLTVEMHCVTVFPCVVTKMHEQSKVDRAHIETLLTNVNKIYRQIGLCFVLDDAEIPHVQDDNLAKYGLTRAKYEVAIRNIMPSREGIEVYFIPGGNGRVNGKANEYGIVLKETASHTTLAHEIGHVCRLADIYVTPPFLPEIEDSTPIELLDWLHVDRMPQDWNNGTGRRFYDLGLRQKDVINRLLMCGKRSEYKADIPLGSVYGLTTNTLSGVQYSPFVLQNANVGRSGMINFPPKTL